MLLAHFSRSPHPAPTMITWGASGSFEKDMIVDSEKYIRDFHTNSHPTQEGERQLARLFTCHMPVLMPKCLNSEARYFMTHLTTESMTRNYRKWPSSRWNNAFVGDITEVTILYSFLTSIAISYPSDYLNRKRKPWPQSAHNCIWNHTKNWFQRAYLFSFSIHQLTSHLLFPASKSIAIVSVAIFELEVDIIAFFDHGHYY